MYFFDLRVHNAIKDQEQIAIGHIAIRGDTMRCRNRLLRYYGHGKGRHGPTHHPYLCPRRFKGPSRPTTRPIRNEQPYHKHTGQPVHSPTHRKLTTPGPSLQHRRLARTSPHGNKGDTGER